MIIKIWLYKYGYKIAFIKVWLYKKPGYKKVKE